MNRIISSLGLSALLAVSAAAGAANRDSRPAWQTRPQGVATQERGQPPRQSQPQGQNQRDDRRDDGRNDNRADNRNGNGNAWGNSRGNNGWGNNNRNGRDYAQQRYRGGWYQAPRGYAYQQWRRGDRLPSAYYARPYVVYDYNRYALYSPPRGYQWVRYNNDVLLTAIATGVVLDVLYNLYY